MEHSAITWSVFSACLVLSFILSGLEAGVFALSRLRIRRQMRSGRRSAELLHDYLEHPENFLWTILVANTVANFIILGWLVVVLHAAFPSALGWFLLSYSFAVFLFYALFDLLPKMLFRSFPTRLCLFFARPFRVVHVLFRPLVALVESVSGLLLQWRGGRVFTGHLFGNREELRLLMQESSPSLSSEERTMINRVMDLPSLTVRQVMTPLAQAAMVPAHTPVLQVLQLARERQLSRVPLLQERDGHQRIMGLVSIAKLLYHENLEQGKPVAEFATPALYLAEDVRVEVALNRMQRSGQRLAVVLGRDRREVGLLSLRDILKVLFGEVSL